MATTCTSQEFVLKAAAPADITNLESMPPYIIVVDCSCMGSIDSSGIDAIEELPGLLATAAGHWRSKRIGHFKKRLAKAQRQQANDVSLAHLKALVATAKAQVWTAPQLFYTALRGAVRDRLTTYRRLKEVWRPPAIHISSTGWMLRFLTLYLLVLRRHTCIDVPSFKTEQ